MDSPDRTKFEQAQAAAQAMTPQVTQAELERRKDLAVKKFFGESGIPAELKKGWAIYEQRIEKRKEVGAPLPPGGVMLLGREATVAGVLAEAHMKLAAALRIDSKALRLRLKRSELTGKINIVANVNPPDDWIIPVSVGGPDDDPKERAKEYIRRVLVGVNEWFRAVVEERLTACERLSPVVGRGSAA